ncbi:MAG: acyltransferase family protein [Bacteroidaceae bacterium]|nr:acyltransferase family protein [Bacteroidaceae bacterium]
MTNSKVETRRDQSFDVLKGILILIVVLGHALQYQYQEDCWHQPLFDGIYTFHMPLFVFVSGFFFYSCTRRSFHDMIVNKSKRLMLPWLIWSIVLVVAMCIIQKETFFSLSTREKGTILFQEFQTFWYLICVFVLTLFYYPIFKKDLYKKKLIHIAVVAFLFLAWLLSLIFFDDLPWFCLKYCQITRQTLVFGLGVLYCLYGRKLTGGGIFLILTLAVAGIVYDRLSWGRWIFDYTLEQRIIDGIWCTIIAFMVLKNISNVVSKQSWLCKPLAYLGKNSLGIYLVHIAFFHPMLKNQLLPSYHTVSSSIILFACYLVISIIIIEIIKRLLKDKSYLLGI